MVKLGAHMSIAGGYYKAVDAASQFDMDVVQLFTKNNNQWNAKEILGSEVDRFNQSLKESGVTNPLSHASYLINLASPKDELWNKSIDGMVIEWQRAEQLGLDELTAPWMQRSVERLCDWLDSASDVELECGGLYHGLSGLRIYRDRLPKANLGANVNSPAKEIP